MSKYELGKKCRATPGFATQQQFKDNCDVKKLLQKFKVTGIPQSSTLKYGEQQNLTLDAAFDLYKKGKESLNHVNQLTQGRYRGDPRSLIAKAQEAQIAEARRRVAASSKQPKDTERHGSRPVSKKTSKKSNADG